MMDDEKRRLRKELLARRDKITTAQRVIRSADILERLFALEAMRAASWVNFYVSYGSEVETTGMIAHALVRGKRVAVPKMDPAEKRLLLSELKDPVRDLSPAPLGIPEPKPEAFRPVEAVGMDLIVTPGVAFDETGRRLGRGGGYYDRYLSDLSGKIPVVALAFELQMVPEVPEGARDIRVDWIITEKRVIKCREE